MNRLIILVFLISSTLVCCSSAAGLRRRRSAVGPKWPTKRILYTFEDGPYFTETSRVTIKNALRMLQESVSINGETCVEFAERLKSEPDYVRFVKRDGCYTYVGHRPGENIISLGTGCVNTGTILHEMLHKLGFDHEHSRSDRDQHVNVLIHNTRVSDQFEKLQHRQETDLETPYDFHSIIHYTSYQGTKNVFGTSDPVLLAKPPVLISNSNEIEFTREFLSPIDIYKIQRFYGCPTLPMPKIVNQTEQAVTGEAFERVVKRFALETVFKGVTEDIMLKYLNKTIRTCGMDHYWPVNYPLVDNDHWLYNLMCQPKRARYEKCRLSFECRGENSVCLRLFYMPTGFCAHSSNSVLNKMLEKAHDVMLSLAHKIKKMFSVNPARG